MKRKKKMKIPQKYAIVRPVSAVRPFSATGQVRLDDMSQESYFI
jgi:hypothetical protein